MMIDFPESFGAFLKSTFYNVEKISYLVEWQITFVITTAIITAITFVIKYLPV